MNFCQQPDNSKPVISNATPVRYGQVLTTWCAPAERSGFIVSAKLVLMPPVAGLSRFGLVAMIWLLVLADCSRAMSAAAPCCSDAAMLR